MRRDSQINDKQSYFEGLLKKLQSHNRELGLRYTSYEQTQDISARCIEQTFDEIMIGMIHFKQTSDKIEEIIQMPLHKKIGDDITEIDQKIKQNEEMLRQAKRELIAHKKKQQQAMKLQNQIKARQNQQKIKAWAQKQKAYKQKRQNLFQKWQKQIQDEQKRLQQQQQEKKQEKIEQRKRSLEQRLKAFQQNKQRRRQLFQQSLQQTKKIKQPKFKLIEEQYQKVLAQQQFEKQIIKKNIKISKQVNFQLIKDHQKNYLEKIYERMKQKGYSSLKQLNEEDKQMYESRFKNLLKRTEEEIQQQKQKWKRRSQYQQRLSEINVNVDDAKRIKIEIARDKAKNPLKYNFLRQKQLNDYQIYMEFKDFQLDIDRNQLGKNYLQEAKRIGEQSRMKKSHSVSAINHKPKQKEQKYRNYLPEIRTQRSSAHNLQKNPTSKQSIEQVFKRQSNRQKAIETISISLRKYDDTIKQKRDELKSLNSINTTLKKQRQIDDMYMKSLKAKLACLQLQ